MVNSIVGKALTVFVIITLLSSTYCTSTRVISTKVIEPEPDTIQNQLKKGDIVTIYTKDGRNFEFKIIDISSVAITGVRYDLLKEPEENLPFDTIAKIEKMKKESKRLTVRGEKSIILLVLLGMII